MIKTPEGWGDDQSPIPPRARTRRWTMPILALAAALTVLGGAAVNAYVANATRPKINRTAVIVPTTAVLEGREYPCLRYLDVSSRGGLWCDSTRARPVAAPAPTPVPSASN